MTPSITARKEPRWIIALGVVLSLFGLIPLIPLKVKIIQSLDIPMLIFAGFGVALLIVGGLRIGWRLNLEGNVLYYMKFNLYSDWKKIRSQEFALPLKKISKMEIVGSNLVITYQPSKKLRFSTKGLSSKAKTNLDVLINEIESVIHDSVHA